MATTNGVMMQYFEWYLPEDFGLWNKLKENAPELAKHGITAVWMPPAYKGQAGKADVGYGVYDIYDLGEFDQKGSVATKYGTREEYLAAIKALQQNHIQAYADIVLNHMIGADQQETVAAVQDAEDDRNRQISEEHKIKAWTKFTFPGRKGKYSDFVWDHTCFNGVDFDAKTKQKAIYNFTDDWSENTDKENGNSDYLMGANVNFDNPKVVEHLKEWGHWYLDTTKVDGFRIDAAKHINSDFFPLWLKDLREYYGKEFFTVAEYWHGDRNVLEDYLGRVDRCMSLFDVPLHFNFHHASLSNGEYDMSKLLSGSLVETDPEIAVTFVDNHDTQIGQALESSVAEWFIPLAYAVILLRAEGYPCIFYGDYYGMQQDRDGRNYQQQINTMLDLRSNRLYGPKHDYFDDFDVVGWTFEGDEEHADSGLAVIMTNRLAGNKLMSVGQKHSGETWVDVLSSEGAEVKIDENGNGLFYCEAGSVSIWTKK